jgi:hypothetical protein
MNSFRRTLDGRHKASNRVPVYQVPRQEDQA